MGPEGLESVVRSLAGYDWEFYDLAATCFSSGGARCCLSAPTPSCCSMHPRLKTGGFRIRSPGWREWRAWFRRRIPFLRRRPGAVKGASTRDMPTGHELKERLLLHVGYHKTATTWLQEFVFRNPDLGFFVRNGGDRIIHEFVNPAPFSLCAG